MTEAETEKRRAVDRGEVRPSVGFSVLPVLRWVFYDSIWKLILCAAAFRKCSEVSVIKNPNLIENLEPRCVSFFGLLLRAGQTIANQRQIAEREREK